MHFTFKCQTIQQNSDNMITNKDESWCSALNCKSHSKSNGNLSFLRFLKTKTVLLHTTVGDIDIELWSKEAPKACRNFVQLCLEGYYDGTVFHRLVKGFIVQGGDPKGDGTGGESIYGHPFKDEFHSRLRFVRRGLVAMANSGKDDNESQFFFTLGATPELQNKNTIFGKVTGNTLYNMIKLEEGLVDQEDRPLYPHKIISCKVLSNPFPDIVPRVKEGKEDVKPEKPKEKVKKNLKLLSFGEEAEEDEAEIEAVISVYKGQSKSSHDLANDPKLSSVPAVDFNDGFSKTDDPESVDSIRKKLQKAGAEKAGKSDTAEIPKELDSSEENEVESKRKEIRKQIKELKKELRKKPEKVIEAVEEAPEEKPKEENSVVAEYHKEFAFYKTKTSLPKKGSSEREQQTLMLLEKFKGTLQKANEHPEDDEHSEKTEKEDSWLTHVFQAEDETVVLAKDANLPSSDRYDLTDPRNPMNQRRRERKEKRQRTK